MLYKVCLTVPGKIKGVIIYIVSIYRDIRMQIGGATKRCRTEDTPRYIQYEMICACDVTLMADGVSFEMRQVQVATRLLRAVAGRQLGRTGGNSDHPRANDAQPNSQFL
jgi:hypothetical protein